MTTGLADRITPELAQTLDGVLRQRAARTPQAVAYRYFDATSNRWQDLSWAETERQVARWRAAFARESLQHGDRVAMLLRNSPEWVIFDQAALSLGLVTVPLYANDSAQSIAYILKNADVTLLLLQDAEHWQRLQSVLDQLDKLKRFLILAPPPSTPVDPRLRQVSDWLADAQGDVNPQPGDPGALATIVYTSGTTGAPKGVMLSHRNILWNAYATLQMFPVYPQDSFLSFLPLSHTFERSLGCYLPMMVGASVAYARSVPLLGEDLAFIQPTILLTVPKIFQKAYGEIQTQLKGRGLRKGLFDLAVRIGWQRFLFRQGRGPWHSAFLLWPLFERLVAHKVRAKMGGRLRLMSCGAAPLAPDLARVFVGLGFPITQGYGLTEASPVVSGNPLNDNDPASVRGSPTRGGCARWR
jgi:long-chain acyl-CoA synthetase